MLKNGFVSAAVMVFCMFAGFPALPAAAQQNAGDIEKLKREIEALKNKRKAELEEIEEQESRERELTIANYESFLRKYPDSPKRGDILFQLARAYFEKEEADYMADMGNYEKQLAKFGRGETKTKPVEPVKDYAKTIDAYKMLMNEFPDYDMMDAVLYTLGYCYKEMRQFEESFLAYSELAERFPKKKYAFEAHFHIGEYLFEQQDYVQAIEHYKQVLRAPTRVNFEKAIYKLGWSYYKLSDYMNAVDKFVALIDKAGVNSDLRDESISYIAISFSEFGGIDQAIEYFNGIGNRKYEDEVLHRLGDVYKKSDKLEEAIFTYDKFLVKYPHYRKAPQAHRAIIECLRIMKKYEEANKQREVLIDRYGKGSQWWAANTDQDVRDEALELIEKSLNENVRYYIVEGDRRGDKTLYEKAIERSRMYLENFPDGENAYELNYFLAECLYKLERFEEAIPEYRKVADHTGEQKYAEFASYNIIKCYEQLDNRDKANEKKMTGNKQKLLAAIDTFSKTFTESQSIPELLFMKASIEFKIENFEQARATYNQIAEQFADNHLALRSARMIAISYTKAKQFKEAEEWFLKVLKHPKATKKDIDEATRMVAASIYDYAASLRKDGSNLEAAVIYKRVAAEYPESEIADKALADAGACYEDEKQWDMAAALYEDLAKRYPQSKLAIASLGRAATCREKNDDIDGAITDYELISIKYPNATEAPGALYSAGLLAEKVKSWQRAVDNYSRLRNKYPGSEYTADAVYSIAQAYEKLGNYQLAISTFKEFGEMYSGAKPGMAVDATVRAGEGYYKTGNIAQARLQFKETLRLYDRAKEDGKQVDDEFAAKAYFFLGEIVYDEFAEIAFKQPKRALKKSQNKKATLLKDAIKYYTEAIRFAIAEWTTRATYKIGMAFNDFGNTWYNTELPARLDETQKIGALIQLWGQVPDFYSQSHNYLKSNVKFGKEQGIKNEWVTKSEAQAVAALYQIAQVYLDVADLLRGAPIPAELSEEEKEMYLGELQGQALEKEDVAAEVLKTAYNWAVNEGISNDEVIRVGERLDELVPGVRAEIDAGTIKEEDVKQDIALHVETQQDLDQIIQQTEEDRSGWTEEQWRQLEQASRDKIAAEENRIAGLKQEITDIRDRIAELRMEIDEMSTR